MEWWLILKAATSGLIRPNMALGPGKYDDLCTLVRQTTGAEGVVVIVINGKRGNGFSAQATPAVLLKLPAIIRDVVNQIERNGLEYDDGDPAKWPPSGPSKF